MRSSGIRLDLSLEDKEVKWKLAECPPRAYSELIRSDIPGSSGPKSSRPPTLRPSPPSVLKFPIERPPVVKPTQGELRARVETLVRRPRRVKCKSQDSLERSHSAGGKAPRLGTPSSSPFAKAQVQGQESPPRAEVPKVTGSPPRPISATKAGDSSGRAAGPPLEVMLISIWGPFA